MKKFSDNQKLEILNNLVKTNGRTPSDEDIANGKFKFSSDVSALPDLVLQEFDGFITQMNQTSRFIDKTTYYDGVYNIKQIPIGVIDDNWDSGVCSPVGTTASWTYVDLDVCDQGKQLPLCLVDMRRKYFGYVNMGGTVPDVVPYWTELIDALKEKIVRRRDFIAVQGLASCGSKGAIAAATASGVVISGTSSFAISTTAINGILGTLQSVTAQAAISNEEAWLQLNEADFKTLQTSVFAVNSFWTDPYKTLASEGGWPCPWAPWVKVYPTSGGNNFSRGGFTHYALLHYKKYTISGGYFGGNDIMAAYDIRFRDFIIDTMFGIDVNFAIPTAYEKPIIALG